MITTILFDYYGVFQPDIYNTWLHHNGLTRTGIFYELGTQLDHGEITRTEFINNLSNALQRPVKPEEIYSPLVTVDQQVVDLVKVLHNTYKIGLLSNASQLLHQKLKEYAIDTLFDIITISSDVGLAKPEKAFYLTALEGLGSQPSEVIYIDDNPRFVDAGKALGLDAIRFTSTDQLREDLYSRRIKF